MKKLFLSLLFFLPLLAFSEAPKNIHEQAREIADLLRCPVCRGVPIAESPSDLAKDMMGMIYQQLEEGKTKDEILNYFVERYGDWILLQPKAEGSNLFLWIIPLLFLIGGAIFISFKTSQWSRNKPNQP